MAAHVAVIGSANKEVVLFVSKSGVLEGKLTYRPGAEGIGGSAINWTRWLNAAGLELDVLCPAGTDATGDKIRALLDAFHIEPNFRYGIPSGSFSNKPNALENATPNSVILVGDGIRTVLSSESAINSHLYDLEDKIRHLTTQTNLHVAMIGNLPTDESSPDSSKRILAALPNDVFVYANGRVQFRHGRSAWGDSIYRINCFQFSLSEAKKFASVLQEKEVNELPEAIRLFLSEKLNVIVTHGRAGATSVFGRVPPFAQSVFFTWPTKPDPPEHVRGDVPRLSIVDPTGAGDAFGAGFVASIAIDLEVNPHALQNTDKVALEDTIVRALDTGGLLGSWACCGPGGRGICPLNKSEIRNYISKNYGTTEVRSLAAAESLLYALDR